MLDKSGDVVLNSRTRVGACEFPVPPPPDDPHDKKYHRVFDRRGEPTPDDPTRVLHEAFQAAGFDPYVQLQDAAAGARSRVAAQGEESFSGTMSTRGQSVEESGVRLPRGRESDHGWAYRQSREAEAATMTGGEAAAQNLSCAYGSIRGFVVEFGDCLPMWLIVLYAAYYNRFVAQCTKYANEEIMRAFAACS